MADRSSVEIEVFPRIHLTLIGMDSAGYRRNGGVGLSISEPSAQVTITRSSEFALVDERARPLDLSEHGTLTRIAKEYVGRQQCAIVISGDMPSHSGFGSATAIRLAVVEGLHLIGATAIRPGRLRQLSLRGGTSGVGINAYFSGGLVFDIGTSSIEHGLAPSSQIEGLRRHPLVLRRTRMPEWLIGLCVPATLEPLSQRQEREFFERICPLPIQASQETLYHVVYGVVAGALERNKKAFCDGVKAVQSCPWKLGERELFGQELRAIESEIYDAGADAVGLSSLGPLLYFLGKDVCGMVERLRTEHPRHAWRIARCRNSGRIVR